MAASTLRAPARRSHTAGFTYLELVIVIALIGILIGVAATRLLPYIEEAERVAVMRVEAQLKNVLIMEAALMIARGDAAALATLNDANPMAFLLEPPRTYLGEIKAPTHDLLPTRSWYFDTGTRYLVYRAGRGFESDDGPVLHEYVVRVAFGNRDPDHKLSTGGDEFQGVRLQRVVRDDSGV